MNVAMSSAQLDSAPEEADAGAAVDVEVDVEVDAEVDADFERRFGGLRRLFGDAGYARLRSLRVAIVGVGGVGSWAAEALARCGVASLTLIDLDHVAESNINRQVQATGDSIGAAKVLALQARIASIHPGCEVHPIEAFVDEGNWPQLLPPATDAVIDACDERGAKLMLARWALKNGQGGQGGQGTSLVISGAAGGKRLGHRVEVEDLSAVTHDPLLAALRQQLRRSGHAPRTGRMGLRCIFSREEVKLPTSADGCSVDGSLNCHGYGSSVTVTAAFGLAAAGEVIDAALQVRNN